ncbi:beta propeller repeat protein [Peterkaempfera griseoplana]|uniref:hypothetical protein n=1 Tax=Peterkaempfera griseoplana TaxID=66896 RepID=UPI0006E2F914|nr:hypothetical protein [Peterkaempfera griseoplana]
MRIRTGTAAVTALALTAVVAAASPAGALAVPLGVRQQDAAAAAGWTTEPFPPGDIGVLAAARVDARTTWAAGRQVVSEGDGKENPPVSVPVLLARDDAVRSWTPLAVPDGYRGRLNAIGADRAGGVWVTGDHPDADAPGVTTAHWDGGTWQQASAPLLEPSWGASLLSVSATGPRDVWAVGARQPAIGELTFLGLIEHWDGTAWQQIPGPQLDADYWALDGVVADGPADVWAVGTAARPGELGRPLVLHWDGRSWTRTPVPSLDGLEGELYGIAADGPDDIWAVGSYRGTGDGAERVLAAHWDGHRWSRSGLPAVAGTLRTVTARSGDVAAAGRASDGQPLLLRLGAGGWQRIAVPAVAGDAQVAGLIRTGAQLTLVGSASGADGRETPFGLTR